MRLSKLLGKTLRHPPSEAHLTSHRLLARAAYVRGLEGGLFAYLPLGRLALRRLVELVGQELTPFHGQELDVPEMEDADRRDALIRLVRREIDSYRQLPAVAFQATDLLIPEASTRAGLFGAARRPAVEIHAFDDADFAVADRVLAALERVLAACDVPVTWAEAGDEGRKAYFRHEAGDDELARCPGCGYAAQRSWATTAWPEPPDEPELPPKEIETPDCNTIAALAEFLDVPESRTLKMVFYSVDGDVTCVVIRGDRQVDEAKLARVLGTDWYYVSMEHELEAIGAVGGYASPIGLDQSKVRVVADPSVRSGRNFVSGANRPDYHIQNVNVPRDFSPGEWADLARIDAGDPCPKCGAGLEIEAGFELARAVPAAPSRRHSSGIEAEYLDAEGRGQPLWLAGWQLDLGRLLAAVVEGHHDDYGILWPAACAPLDVHLTALDVRRKAVTAQADALYGRLQAEGFSVLYDDQDASAGVKFNDADLIGLPLRLTVSKRSAKEGLIEAKWRDSRERLKLDDEGLAAELDKLKRKT